MTVLIVDDHAPFRQLIRAVFEEAGFEVVGDVADGASAVNTARALTPDVVLLDVHLGDGPDGFEVARQLAALPRPPAVVVTSSRSQSAFLDRIATAPIAGFVAKEDLSPAAVSRLVQHGEAIRVVVAEDSLLFREGLVRVLDDLGFSVVGQVGTSEELLTCLAAARADVVIVDIRMPPTYTTEGLVAAARIGDAYPTTAVMVLSQHLEPDYAIRMLEDQPSRRGYLLKDRVGNLDAFAEALHRIAAGGSVIDPDVVAHLMRETATPLDQLTERELEVLGLMAEGLSNEGIGTRLFVSPRTVETHMSRILDKLAIEKSTGHNPRVAAVLSYLRDAR